MLLAAPFAWAESEEQEPPPEHLLELGVGAGGGFLTDYPGSDQAHPQVAIFPVVFYYGKILRSDRRDGLYARVVHKPRVGVDLSGGGYFPVDSDDNRAREGMQSLGWLGELGPRLYWRIYDEDDRMIRAFGIARAAVGVHAGTWKGRGTNFGIGLGYDEKKIWGREFSAFVRATAYWASQEYNDYFYTVGAKYATPERPAYEANSGYLGTWVQVGSSYEIGNVILSGGVGAILAAGSANKESPLFKEDVNWSAFAGLAWFFYKSEKEGKK